MPVPLHGVLEPRKSPVQARSAASVDAIVEATIQVLLAVGKERLTTSRVASRAGVSVGTLYQYFGNKSSLLQAVLRRHFEQVATAVEEACAMQHGRPASEMAAALVDAFLRAKMLDPKLSVALYSVSADVDGQRLAQEMGGRLHAAIVTMLRSAPDGPAQDADLVASILQGAMAGVSRRLLESEAPEQRFESFRQQLTQLASTYVARPAS